MLPKAPIAQRRNPQRRWAMFRSQTWLDTLVRLSAGNGIVVAMLASNLFFSTIGNACFKLSALSTTPRTFLMWTFEPPSVRGMPFSRLQKAQVWMSRAELIRRYAQDDSACKE
jgi:hypothetical protein